MFTEWPISAFHYYTNCSNMVFVRAHNCPTLFGQTFSLSNHLKVFLKLGTKIKSPVPSLLPGGLLKV